MLTISCGFYTSANLVSYCIQIFDRYRKWAKRIKRERERECENEIKSHSLLFVIVYDNWNQKPIGKKLNPNTRWHAKERKNVSLKMRVNAHSMKVYHRRSQRGSIIWIKADDCHSMSTEFRIYSRTIIAFTLSLWCNAHRVKLNTVVRCKYEIILLLIRSNTTQIVYHFRWWKKNIESKPKRKLREAHHHLLGAYKKSQSINGIR